MSKLQNNSNKARSRRNKTRLRVKAMRDRVKSINHPKQRSWYSQATPEERQEADDQTKQFLLTSAKCLAEEGQLDCDPDEVIQLIYDK